ADVDGRADYFALGRTLTAILQRRHPQHADPGKLGQPWRTLCEILTEHDPDDRPDSVNEILTTFFKAFAKSGIAVRDMDKHVVEMSHLTIDGWPEFCNAHFNSLSDVKQSDLVTATKLREDVIANGAFNVNTFFEKVEASSAVSEFESSFIDFDD